MIDYAECDKWGWPDCGVINRPTTASHEKPQPADPGRQQSRETGGGFTAGSLPPDC